MKTLRIAVLALAMVGCAAADGNDTIPVVAAVPVRVADVQDAEFAEPVVATGLLTTHDELQLSFKVGGIVARVLVQDGQTVRRGQVLATLDLREIDAQVAKVRTAFAKSERDLARVRNLERDSVATLEQLQDATSARDVARADLNAVSFNRSYATIVAPADGVILRKVSDAGETVAPGQPIVILGSASSGSVVRVGVADRDVVRLQLGDRADISFSAYPGQSFAGVVTEIPAAANPMTGTYAVEVRLANMPRMTTGLTAAVRIQPRAAGSMRFIPIESITEADGNHGFVYTVENNIAHRIAVTVANIDENRVAISDGLESVRMIVTSGAAYLSEGAKVKVVP